jgi:hypothetical protein
MRPLRGHRAHPAAHQHRRESHRARPSTLGGRRGERGGPSVCGGPSELREPLGIAVAALIHIDRGSEEDLGLARPEARFAEGNCPLTPVRRKENGV